MSPTMLGRRRLAGLLKVGDVLVPGHGAMPSFSASGAAEHAERMLASMNPADRDGVRLLLGLFALTPRRFVRAFMALTERQRSFPEPVAAALRMISIGIKGVVMTLYYSDVGEHAEVFDAIGWTPKIVRPGARVPTEQVPPKPAPLALTSASESRAEEAMILARAAQTVLRRLSLAERLGYLRTLRGVVLERRDEIVARIQKDTGKSRCDALTSEIYGVLEYLTWLVKQAPKSLADRKEHTPLALLGKTSWTYYEPLGTVLVISPWNYPFYQALVPIATALAAGNTVVYKPSESTPLEGLIESLLGDAGVAPSWVQVVYGDGSVGAELIEQGPDKIFFTGSTRTGKKVMELASGDATAVELELGGKDAMVVFEDAVIERAVAGAVWGGLTNTGQSCTSVERVYVQASVYERFRDALVGAVGDVVQGSDGGADVDIGAMTTDFQVEIVARHLEDARSKGATVLTGKQWDGRSRLIPPIVIDNVDATMLVLREETFGPVLPLIPFETEAEAIAMANDSPYGLTSSVWSADLDRAKRVARSLEVGGVSINNVMLTEGNPALPFGGIKKSGFGRHKGEHGLHGFCNVKSVLVDKSSGETEANWYPYTREKYRLFDRMTAAQFGGSRLWLIRFILAGLRLQRYAGGASRRSRRDVQ